MQCTKPCKVSHAQTLPAGECSTTCKLCSTALAKNYCRLSLHGNSDLNSDQACKGHCVSLCNIPQFQPFLITANIESSVARITIYVVKTRDQRQMQKHCRAACHLIAVEHFATKTSTSPFFPWNNQPKQGWVESQKKSLPLSVDQWEANPSPILPPVV